MPFGAAMFYHGNSTTQRTWITIDDLGVKELKVVYLYRNRNMTTHGLHNGVHGKRSEHKHKGFWRNRRESRSFVD
jgi:hypothetical protein